MSVAGSADQSRSSAAMASVTTPQSTASAEATGSRSDDQSRSATLGGGSSSKSAAARGRRVRLTVSRVDPWSMFKISFLLSVALGIAGVIAVAVLWTILSGWGVFADVNRIVGEVVGNTENPFDILDYVGFGRVVSLSIVIGVVDVVLMTAIATLGSIIYNLCSSLVGGIQLTLSDD